MEQLIQTLAYRESSTHDEPLKVISWEDTKTEAKGWIVIDSLINGIAGGGLFMHPNATLKEVSDLAKSMSYKNCVVQNPRLGGAKGGIRFDHKSPEANGVLARFLADNKEIISKHWCTGGDLNTSNEAIEAIVKNELGLPTAFVCLARSISKIDRIPDQSTNMSDRIVSPVNELFNIGQCATGYSICQTINTVTNKKPKVLIQGFGKVGSSLAFFLQNLNIGTVVGICDVDGFIYNEEGIDVTQLIKAKSLPSYCPNSPLRSLLTDEQRQKYNWTSTMDEDRNTLSGLLSSIDGDVLAPCAERYSVNENAIKKFKNGKEQQFIISGANNPFKHADLVSYCLENNITVIPDWVSNSGNAILFVEALRSSKWDSSSASKMLDLIGLHIQNFLNKAKELSVSNRSPLFDSCYLVAQQRHAA